jgi:vacuole morphology and inheritance protein 14
MDDHSTFGLGDLHVNNGGPEVRNGKEAAGRPPPVPVKDAPAPVPVAKTRTGLGRQFGRLGGAVGRGKRAQQ